MLKVCELLDYLPLFTRFLTLIGRELEEVNEFCDITELGTWLPLVGGVRVIVIQLTGAQEISPLVTHVVVVHVAPKEPRNSKCEQLNFYRSTRL